MNDEELFFDEDEQLPVGEDDPSVFLPDRKAVSAEKSADSPRMVSLIVALLMTLAGLLAGLLVGLMVPVS